MIQLTLLLFYFVTRMKDLIQSEVISLKNMGNTSEYTLINVYYYNKKSGNI